MRLGIDLDGVVANFNAGWIRIHADEFGSDLDPEGVDSWDGLGEFAGFSGMNEFWKWASPKPHRRSIFRNLTPYPGAVESLHDLERAGHKIVIVTTKPRWAREDTLHWIADNGLPTDEVHMIDAKYQVDCDVYLDDSPTVLPSLVEHRSDRLICRFIRPWNEPLDGTTDVADWPDFVAAVTERSHT